jgi:hypothetical protein
VEAIARQNESNEESDKTRLKSSNDRLAKEYAG